MDREQVRDQLQLKEHAENGELYRRFEPALAMADTIKRYVYPPGMVLVLPLDWYPTLEHFNDYDVVHADVPDAMVAVKGYRVA